MRIVEVHNSGEYFSCLSNISLEHAIKVAKEMNKNYFRDSTIHWKVVNDDYVLQQERVTLCNSCIKLPTKKVQKSILSQLKMHTDFLKIWLNKHYNMGNQLYNIQEIMHG